MAGNLSRLGEFHLIDRIVHSAGEFKTLEHLRLRMGPGDDAAVLEGPDGMAYVWTADLCQEGIHFRRDWIEPGAIGYKCLAVNFSDIAAMGARPVAYLVSVARPEDCDDAWLEEFFNGIHWLGRRCRAALAGGDMSGSLGGVSVHITVLGEAPADRIVTRAGARPGDGLYVSRHLGGAGMALDLMWHPPGESTRIPGARRITGMLFKPQPEMRLGWELGGGSEGGPTASALIDLSDGLSGDLMHIGKCSGVGFLLEAPAIPISRAVHAHWSGKGEDPLQHALHDGEDYHLLFTVPPERERRIPALSHKTFRIGTVVEGSGIRLRHADGRIEAIAPRSWDHFSAK